MIEIFVKRPVTTIMFVLFLIILGVQSLSKINIEDSPPVEFPMITVQITYPGASPEEVEQDILKDLEDAIAEVSEIKKIESIAYNSVGFIFIEFNYGVSPDIKSIEVKDKVDAISNDLPSLADTPIIQKLNILSTPVIDIVLRSNNHSPSELWDFADDKAKPFLTSISGISSVDILGGREREIKISLDSSLMQMYYITIDDVVNAVQMYNLNFPGGTIKGKNNELSIKFFGEFQSIEEIENLIITTSEGSRISLKDIAIIKDGVKDIETIAKYNEDEIILLSLIKVSDANAIEVAKQLETRLPQLENLLEEGMTIETANNTTTVVLQNTYGTIQSIIVGVLLTVIILIIFTGNIRSTFIISLVLPSSIISAIFLVQMSGFTINSMSLLAFATVLGTLIANAVVIIDSSLHHMEKGEDSETAAINGTKSVVGEVFAASGTNLAVFIPLSTMDGLIGEFMTQFGMTVVYTTVLSLLISFSLTPMLLALFFKKSKNRSSKERKNIISKLNNKLGNFSHSLNKIMLKEYKLFFKLIFKYKKISLLLIFFVFFWIISFGKYVGVDFFPSSDTNKIEISVKTPMGSSIEKTQSKADIITQRLENIPEIDYIISKIGEDGNENASIILQLVNAAERNLSDLEIITQIIPILSDIPDIEVETKRGSQDGPPSADITINIFGEDYNKIVSYSKEIQEIMNKMGNYSAVSSSYRNPPNEYRFIPDQQKLRLYDISNSSISSAIRTSLYGNDDSNYRENGKQYDIRIELLEKDKINDDFLKNIYLSSPKGLISLNELGSIDIVESVPNIKRRDRSRIIELSAYISKGTSVTLQNEIDKLIAQQIDFEEGYGYYYAGNSEIQGEANASLLTAFLLAIIFTYMILAAVMNSLLHPFTIAISIVASFSGIIFFLFFTGLSFNMASQMAVIMLVGLAVNAAILLVNNAINNVRSGMKIEDALWKSFEEKLRAIFMTSLAIVFGTLPQLFSHEATKASMGAVIIGGVLASVLFTLTLIPLVFYYFETMKQKLFGKPSLKE